MFYLCSVQTQYKAVPGNRQAEINMYCNVNTLIIYYTLKATVTRINMATLSQASVKNGSGI